MKKLIMLLFFAIATSCAVRMPSGESKYRKGVIYQIVGNRCKAIYICLDSTQCIKICNYTGNKKVNDTNWSLLYNNQVSK